jgi:hypothetical protein
MKIVQKLPDAQVEILKEALKVLSATLKVVDSEGENEKIQHKEFDITTLLGMLNGNEVKIELTQDSFDEFTMKNGVDFPEYIQ